TFTKVGVVGVFGADHLDGGGPVVTVETEVDADHAAGTEQSGDPERADTAGVVRGEVAHGGFSVAWHGGPWQITVHPSSGSEGCKRVGEYSCEVLRKVCGSTKK